MRLRVTQKNNQEYNVLSIMVKWH